MTSLFVICQHTDIAVAVKPSKD